MNTVTNWIGNYLILKKNLATIAIFVVLHRKIGLFKQINNFSIKIYIILKKKKKEEKEIKSFCNLLKRIVFVIVTVALADQ